MKHFTREQLIQARKADLYKFLVEYHSGDFTREGQNYIRFNRNGSINIRRGHCGYRDYETQETGNSVDFLVNYLGYQLDEAVFALSGTNYIVQIEPFDYRPDNLPVVFPQPINGQFKNTFAYLKSRNIKPEIIEMLIHQKLLYQERDHNNIVFINREREFAEIHGTLTYGKSFHGCIGSKAGHYWGFQIGDDPDTVYICEAAIDAISLYQILNEPAYYTSISGVGNQAAIDKIKNDDRFRNVVLAVDNDDAGQTCRSKNPELESIIPINKDWNEDLI